jgi:hypothetical protein
MYIGSFISDEQRGLNIGLGFDYYINTEVTNLNEGIAHKQKLEKDLMRISLRTAYLWDFIKLKNTTIFVEPGFNFGYAFGDEALTFSDGNKVDVEKWDFTSFVNLGFKLNL